MVQTQPCAHATDIDRPRYLGPRVHPHCDVLQSDLREQVVGFFDDDCGLWRTRTGTASVRRLDVHENPVDARRRRRLGVLLATIRFGRSPARMGE